MNKTEIVNEKLDVLKLEISILNQRQASAVDRLWKIRQISLTLWLATIGVGLGIVSKDGQPNIAFLALSALIPVWFSIIDSRNHRWWILYVLRDIQIQKFLSTGDYILPATKEKISYHKSLENDELSFPIYDLIGNETFGNSKYIKWQRGMLMSYTSTVPFLLYGILILASVFFTSLQLSNKILPKLWWILPAITLLMLTSLYLYARLKEKNLRKAEKEWI